MCRRSPKAASTCSPTRWNALVGPGGLSKDVVATINAEVTQTLAEPAVIEKLKLQLITPSPTTPDQLRKRMADEKAL